MRSTWAASRPPDDVQRRPQTHYFPKDILSAWEAGGEQRQQLFTPEQGESVGPPAIRPTARYTRPERHAARSQHAILSAGQPECQICDLNLVPK